MGRSGVFEVLLWVLDSIYFLDSRGGGDSGWRGRGSAVTGAGPAPDAGPLASGWLVGVVGVVGVSGLYCCSGWLAGCRERQPHVLPLSQQLYIPPYSSCLNPLLLFPIRYPHPPFSTLPEQLPSPLPSHYQNRAEGGVEWSVGGRRPVRTMDRNGRPR